MKTFGKILFGMLLVIVGLGYYGLKQMSENEDLRKAQGMSWKQLEFFGFERPQDTYGFGLSDIARSPQDQIILNKIQDLDIALRDLRDNYDKTMKKLKDAGYGNHSQVKEMKEFMEFSINGIQKKRAELIIEREELEIE